MIDVFLSLFGREIKRGNSPLSPGGRELERGDLKGEKQCLLVKIM
jgi:hypothetical protein